VYIHSCCTVLWPVLYIHSCCRVLWFW